MISSDEATALSFLSHNAVRWFIFIPHRKRNESNLLSLVEHRSSSLSGVRHESCDIWHLDALHYELWKIIVCMITTCQLGSVKGETRETIVTSQLASQRRKRVPFPRDLYTNTYGIFIVFDHLHGIRALVRRGENRIGGIQLNASLFLRPRRYRCRDRFGNTVARVHRDRIPRIRVASSRERTNPGWLRTCLLRPAALSWQYRYIGCNSSSPVGVRALITHEDYVANSSINICRIKDIRA